jgi:DNA-binding LacI/PurR family transcriptional regulator
LHNPAVSLLHCSQMDNETKQRPRKKKGARPTAQDIAKLAGVSQSTVSRILAGDPSHFFSEKTRQRVLSVAAEQGYSPHPIARALRGKQTQLIGLIVRGITDPFFAELVSELSVQARALGYQVILGHAHSDPNEVLQVSKVLDPRQTDGVILLGDWQEDEQAVQEILEGRRAVVAMCRGGTKSQAITVNSDNRAGMVALLDHLTGLGHRRLAFISGGWLGDLRERRDEFIRYADQKGISIDPRWLIDGDDNPESGYRALEQLLTERERPTAILAADDLLAIGILKSARDRGIRVPEDFSVTGFDGIELARYVCPALTTVRQPIDAMSRLALENLMAQIRGEPNSPHQLIRVTPQLILRESTGPAK